MATESPKKGDLVLLWRFKLDGQHSGKLEPRWEGPYILHDIGYNNISGRLRDVNTGKIVRVRAAGRKEHCHLDDMEVFIERKQEWITYDGDLCGLDRKMKLRSVGYVEADEATERVKMEKGKEINLWELCGIDDGKK
ncbi:hypothetical protein RUND412_008934 [Rhizina undulata]